MDVYVRHKNGEIVNTVVDDDEKIVSNFSTTHLRNITTWDYSNDMFLKFMSAKDLKTYYFKIDTVYNFVIDNNK